MCFAPALRSAGLLRFFILFTIVSALFATGCTSVPPGRSAVKSIDVSGTDAIDAEDLREKLQTVPSPKFLGLFQGVVYDYSVFDRFVLERDLQRIERYYRAQGYYQARARAGRVFFVSSNKVRVDIQVEEGPKVTIGRVDIHGLESLDKDVAKRIERQVKRRLRFGPKFDDEPFQEDRFEKAGEFLQRTLEDNGYAYVKVTRAADVDLPKGKVAVGFWVVPGPITRFGEVTITGLGKIPEEPVRRALDIKKGDKYSRAELDAAEQALLELNVFSSVVIEPQVDAAGATREKPEIPLKVKLEAAKLKGIHVGGGAQIDSIQTDVHLLGGWEHRNLFGGLRSLTFEVKPGVVLYPTRFPTFQTPQKLLPEGRFNAQFRQPGFIEARTGLFSRLDGSIAPVILSPDVTDGPILGYRDIRLTNGLDRSIWKFYGAVSHTLQFDSAFTYAGALDPDLHPVMISYPELYVSFDLRNDKIRPHEGVYVDTDWQVAGLGGDAKDVKTTSEVRGYLPLSRRWTLAARVRVGMLFPSNYGGTIERGANGEDLSGIRPTWVRDIQLMFLRGFFAGGLGSNRGYALREIGPHGIVPQATSTLARGCDPNNPTSATCDLPLGGFTLWEASLELRFPISGDFGGALFTDTADVSDRKVDFRLNRPHLSVGLGFRYDTPVGPIRLDAGYRVPGLQAPAGSLDEGIPSKTFGLPMALSFGIGEAF